MRGNDNRNTDNSNIVSDILSSLGKLEEEVVHIPNEITNIYNNFSAPESGLLLSEFQNRLDTLAAGSAETQEEIDRVFLINPSLSGTVSQEGKEESTEITNIGTLFVYDYSLGFAAHKTKDIEIAGNAIPGTEWSLCIPFVNLQLIPRSGEYQDGRGINSLSFFSKEEPSQSQLDVVNAKATLNYEGEQVEDSPFSGMELFTTPQTFTNGDEVYPLSGESDRTEPVRDRFLPFMVLKSMDFDVLGPDKTPLFLRTSNVAAASVTYIQGNIKLTLLDRSRLHEIGELVSPGVSTGQELIIEFGWSHPHGGLESEANTYADFIDSMRIKQKHIIATSKLNFNEDHTVDIILTTYTRAAGDQRGVNIIEDDQYISKARAIKQISVGIRDKKAKDENGVVEVGEEVVKNFYSQTGNQGFVDSQVVTDILDDLRTDTSVTAADLESYKSRLTATSAPQDRLNKKIQYIRDHAVDFKYTGAGVSDLPGTANIPADIFTSNKYVPLATIITAFVLEPLASAKRVSNGKSSNTSTPPQYNEIQLITYMPNPFSSFAHVFNIGEIMVDFDEFYQKGLKKRMDKGSIPTLDIVVSLLTAQLSRQTNFLYGMGRPGAKGAVKSEPDTVLEQAYGTSYPKTFKQINLKFYYEEKIVAIEGSNTSILRVHVYDGNCTSNEYALSLFASTNGKAAAPSSEISSRMTSRINDGDGRGSSLKGGTPDSAQQEASVSTKINVEEAVSTLTFSQTKKLLKNMMPYIVVDSEGSFILNSSLDTNQNTLLAKLFTQRVLGADSDVADGNSLQGVKDPGVPLTLLPSVLTLTTIGMPSFRVGQSFFVDFMTGTTIDSIYSIVDVKHKLSPGKFESTISMQPTGNSNVYNSIISRASQASSESTN